MARASASLVVIFNIHASLWLGCKCGIFSGWGRSKSGQDFMGAKVAPVGDGIARHPKLSQLWDDLHEKGVDMYKIEMEGHVKTHEHWHIVYYYRIDGNERMLYIEQGKGGLSYEDLPAHEVSKEYKKCINDSPQLLKKHLYKCECTYRTHGSWKCTSQSWAICMFNEHKHSPCPPEPEKHEEL
mmetsp:Transcript_101588/g.180143  ORF Transcript_101588/g.180143 Transcript_101588/m.180143 type:complete len:183 (+) Transcript_101588:86-634(+)